MFSIQQTQRQPSRQETVVRVRRALDVGMRILSAPRLGGIRIEDANGDLYAKDADEAAASIRLGRYELIATAIEARGLGFAHLLKLDALAPRAPRAARTLSSIVSLRE
jgi:hypothetical protein